MTEHYSQGDTIHGGTLFTPTTVFKQSLHASTVIAKVSSPSSPITPETYRSSSSSKMFTAVSVVTFLLVASQAAAQDCTPPEAVTNCIPALIVSFN